METDLVAITSILDEIRSEIRTRESRNFTNEEESEVDEWQVFSIIRIGCKRMSMNGNSVTVYGRIECRQIHLRIPIVDTLHTKICKAIIIDTLRKNNCTHITLTGQNGQKNPMSKISTLNNQVQRESNRVPNSRIGQPHTRNPYYEQYLHYRILQRLHKDKNYFIAQKLQGSAQHLCSTNQPKD